MIIAVLVFAPLLFLCIYKIWRWFHHEDIVGHFRQYNDNRQASAFYKLYRRINRVRVVWYCIGCAVLIIVAAFLPPLCSNGLRVSGVVVGIVVLVLVNNLYVSLRWHCPVCAESFPCKVGRSSLRPQWIECCPHCNYGKP